MSLRRFIEGASLFVLIALAALRPLVSESYDSAGSSMTAALAEIADPSPVATLTFDVLILFAAGGWLLARAVGSGRPYRRTGLEIGAVLVCAAGIASCAFAGNKRLAINATLDWLCMLVAAVALAQLLRTRWHRRLLLAAVLASACVQAVQCFDQYFVGFADTWEQYQANKAEFWARQGVDPGSAKVELFERRMRAREASGFLPHSNVAASYLVLCGFVAAGQAIGRWRRATEGRGRLAGAGAAFLAAVILGAAVLTWSKGALLSAAAGALLWAGVGLRRKWFAANRRAVLAAGWMVCVLVIVGAVAYGQYFGRLPGWSLTFRWGYWKASAAMIADHWMVGVGRENFGRHYLRYKAIESPEEVANPHNLFVQAAADWGGVGLVGVAAMLVGASVVVTRGSGGGVSTPLGRGQRESDGVRSIEGTSESPLPAGVVLGWAAALVAGLLLGRLPLLGTWDTSFLYYTTVTTGLVWTIGFAVFLAAGGDARGGVSNDDAAVAGRGPEPGCAWVWHPVAGAAAGLFAFVLHDMVNFAMFVPGTAITFFAVLAWCMAEVMPVAAGTGRTECQTMARRWGPLAACAGLIWAVLVFGAVPVTRAQTQLRWARQCADELRPGGIDAQPAGRSYLAAGAADPWDPTPLFEHGRWLAAVAGAVPELREGALRGAVESLQAAMARDPQNVHLPRRLAALHSSVAAASGRREDYLAAIGEAQAALALYPLDPSGIVSLGDTQLAAGERLGDAELARLAVKSYEQALALDDQRLPWEEFYRFRPNQTREIRDKIARAQSMLRANR